VSGASLETRIADITKKVHAWEAKMEALKEKLKQHNQELTLREASVPV
jgi:predicted  nucleic acid-binding Zn-ribbon protein